LESFRKKFVFTEVTPIRRVIRKAVYVQFFRIDHDVPGPDLLCEFDGLTKLPFRVSGGASRHGNGLFPQRIMRDFQQKSAVHPA
jgi:hypothetical protein